jgi:hypothetical protein
MTKRILWVTGLLAMTLIGWQVALFAQAAAKATVLPPFKVKAKLMTLDTKTTPAHLVYSTGVTFTSTMNDFDLTCGRLEANFGTVDKVTAVIATGDVSIAMVANEGGNAATATASVYHFSGKASKVLYGLEDAEGQAGKRERVVRLQREKADDAQPTLHIVITNPVTKAEDQTDLKGDTITYNLDTGVLKATEVSTENTGSAQ